MTPPRNRMKMCTRRECILLIEAGYLTTPCPSPIYVDPEDMDTVMTGNVHLSSHASMQAIYAIFSNREAAVATVGVVRKA